MTDKIVTDKELVKLLKDHLLRSLAERTNKPFDKQQVIDACKNMLDKIGEQYSPHTVVKLLEDTDEEKLVREIMEEPQTEIRIEATVQVPITHISISFDIEMVKK